MKKAGYWKSIKFIIISLLAVLVIVYIALYALSVK